MRGWLEVDFAEMMAESAERCAPPLRAGDPAKPRHAPRDGSAVGRSDDPSRPGLVRIGARAPVGAVPGPRRGSCRPIQAVLMY